jgi:hypothetical protein
MVSVNVLLFLVLYEIRATRRSAGGSRPRQELFADVIVALAAMGCLCFIAILLVPVGAYSTRVVQLIIQLFNLFAWCSCFLLYNLDLIRRVVTQGLKAPTRYDVFLSHNWSEGTHDKMIKLEKALTARGVKCFLDQNDFDRFGSGGDLPAQMTHAMDRSHLFLCTINKGYLDKIDGKGHLGLRDNCKFEFTYAINRMGTKRVIPCVTNPQFKDVREWYGPVAGFLVDQFWEVLTMEGKRKSPEKELDEVRLALAPHPHPHPHPSLPPKPNPEASPLALTLLSGGGQHCAARDDLQVRAGGGARALRRGEGAPLALPREAHRGGQTAGEQGARRARRANRRRYELLARYERGARERLDTRAHGEKGCWDACGRSLLASVMIPL